jgi:5-methylcytosine-specific restriction protein A
MPYVRPCRNPWCPNYQPCPDHPIVAFAGSSPMPPGWHRTRAAVLARAGGVCEECRAAPATDVHHIVARHLGGSDDPGNLRALCGACHGHITGRQGRQAGL